MALLKEAAKNSYVHPENTVTCSFPQPGVFLKPDSGEVKTSLLYLHKGQILKGRGFFLCHWYLSLSQGQSYQIFQRQAMFCSEGDFKMGVDGKGKNKKKQRKKRLDSKAHVAHLSLSLSSLLRERSLFSGSRSRSLSLSWFVTEELRSESVGLGHCGGVGKDGGVRWSLFHGSWGLLKFCRFGPSL